MRRAVICFVLGTLLTVATAILAALWAPLDKRSSITLKHDHAEVLATIADRTAFTASLNKVRNNPGCEDLALEQWSGWGCELTVVKELWVGYQIHLPWDPIPSDPAELRTGWPFLCFSSKPAVFLADQRSSSTQGLLVSKPWIRDLHPRSNGLWNATSISLGPPPTTIIPLWPEYLPLLGNIAVWSGTCSILLAGARQARARIRTLRGQCARCCYPIRGLAACPECGPANTPSS